MALSDDTINRYAEACTPNTETGALNYKAFACAIEAAVRKQDDALIRQLVEALEAIDNAMPFPVAGRVLKVARARLESKP